MGMILLKVLPVNYLAKNILMQVWAEIQVGLLVEESPAAIGNARATLMEVMMKMTMLTGRERRGKRNYSQTTGLTLGTQKRKKGERMNCRFNN